MSGTPGSRFPERTLQKPDAHEGSTQFVLRRRIPAIVRLEQSVISGDLYAAADDSKSLLFAMLLRLNDASETYMPLAREDHHLLLKKHQIVFVELEDIVCLDALQSMFTGRCVEVTVEMRGGVALTGMIRTKAGRSARRTLDILNELGRGFFPLQTGSKVVLVNDDQVVSVRDKA